MTGYSVIVISKDNRRLLNNCIEKLLTNIPAGDKDNVEIVVVEALSQGMNNPPLSSEKIKYIPVPSEKAGFATQRNIGVNASNGDYVIFIDDDVEVVSGWFEKIISVAERYPGITGGMGGVYPKTAGILSFTAGVMGHPGGGFRLMEFSKGGIIPLSEVATCNTIMKKEHILSVGGFDKRCDRFSGEDTDICSRIKEKFGEHMFRYIPEACVWHYTTNNLAKMIRWYLRRGVADGDLALMKKSHMYYLLRSSITIKILIALGLTYILSKNFLSTVLFLLAIWYVYQLHISKFMFKYFGIYNFPAAKKILIYLLHPPIKLLMNLAVDGGRLKRFFTR